MGSISQLWALPTDLMRRWLVEEFVLAWLAFCWKEDLYIVRKPHWHKPVGGVCERTGQRLRGWEHKSKLQPLSGDVVIWQPVGYKYLWWRVWSALNWSNGISDPSVGQRQCQEKFGGRKKSATRSSLLYILRGGGIGITIMATHLSQVFNICLLPF